MGIEGISPAFFTNIDYSDMQPAIDEYERLEREKRLEKEQIARKRGQDMERTILKQHEDLRLLGQKNPKRLEDWINNHRETFEHAEKQWQQFQNKSGFRSNLHFYEINNPDFYKENDPQAFPEPTPNPDPSPTPTPKPTPNPDPSPTPTPEPTPNPNPQEKQPNPQESDALHDPDRIKRYKERNSQSKLKTIGTSLLGLGGAGLIGAGGYKLWNKLKTKTAAPSLVGTLTGLMTGTGTGSGGGVSGGGGSFRFGGGSGGGGGGGGYPYYPIGYGSSSPINIWNNPNNSTYAHASNDRNWNYQKTYAPMRSYRSRRTYAPRKTVYVRRKTVNVRVKPQRRRKN